MSGASNREISARSGVVNRDVSVVCVVLEKAEVQLRERACRHHIRKSRQLHSGADVNCQIES